MRRPSLQFYPGDWQSNPKLRRCSHAEKGLWLDVLCILHDQDEYGVIRWPLKDLAIAVHAKPAALQVLVNKGVLKGADVGQTCEPFFYRPRHGGKDGQPVTLIEAQDGPLWYSSRMVRDEHIRMSRSANEPKPKPEPKATPKEGIGGESGQASRLDHSRAGASSSSSTSSSSSENKTTDTSLIFQIREVFDFWRGHLNHERSRLDRKRERTIAARLKEGFSVDDLKQAVRGCKLSPHHMGQNETKTVYDRVDLIFRDTEHVEMFMRKVPGSTEAPVVRKVETIAERLKRESCEKCFGTGTEMVPGKGAKNCDHSNAAIVGSSDRVEGSPQVSEARVP